MITVVTDKKQIVELHRKFHKRLDKFLTVGVDCWVGYPSGSFEDTVMYSSELNIWLSHGEHDNKFWNGFGVGEPIEGRNNSLNGEINFPKEGNYRRVAGAFGVEDNGNILVLHRGKIGGGKPGIGKNYFTDNFRGDFVTAIDGDRETEFCLVGELYSNYFPKQVANFIKEIYRVKQLEDGESATDFSGLSDFNYTAEHSGKTVTERNDPVVIERTHGIVVNALADELKSRGLKVGNDRNRDLFIHNRGQINTLFEVKTSSSTQCLYSTVGQLLLYSIPIANKVSLVSVLPNKLSKTVSKKFQSLGIEILYYEWDGDTPSFLNLDELL
jgi:hypothetical protein